MSKICDMWAFGLVGLVALACSSETKPRPDDDGVGGNGAGGGGGSDADVTAPTVISTTPDNLSRGASSYSSVVVELSEPIDQASVSDASILIVASNGTAIPGIVDADGVNVSFTADSQLFLHGDYTATLADTITDLAGNPLADPMTWEFRTGDGTWSAPSLLEMSGVEASSPQVSMTPAGDAVAVWRQQGGTASGVWARTFDATSGWGENDRIDSVSGVAGEPLIATTPTGDAVAVWVQFDGSLNSLWANRYEAGTGWEGATLIETNALGPAAAPQLVVDGAGNAMTVWTQSSGGDPVLWYNRYDVGSGWAGAARVASGSNRATHPALGADGDGNAVVVWIVEETNGRFLFANRYVPGTGWAILGDLLAVGVPGFRPALAVAADGDALALWHEQSGSSVVLRSRHYEVGTGWGADVSVITIGVAGEVDIVANARGDFLAVWSNDGEDIRGRLYLNDIGWTVGGSPMMNNTGQATFPSVALDERGNAAMVWQESDGARNSIWASRLHVDGAWGDFELLETDNAGDAAYPQIAVDQHGRCLALWAQHDGALSNVFSARFDELKP